MDASEFHHALRILLNIDGPEFMAALGKAAHDGEIEITDDQINLAWTFFRDDPHKWFINAPPAWAFALWPLIQNRLDGTGNGA